LLRDHASLSGLFCTVTKTSICFTIRTWESLDAETPVYVHSRENSSLTSNNIYISVIKPIRHLPHVVNGHLNVANGPLFQYIKIGSYLAKCVTKLEIFNLI